MKNIRNHLNKPCSLKNSKMIDISYISLSFGEKECDLYNFHEFRWIKDVRFIWNRKLPNWLMPTLKTIPFSVWVSSSKIIS